MTISNLLYQLSVYIVLAPLAVGIFLYKRLDNSSKIMLLLLAFATVSQIGSVFLPYFLTVSFYNLYTIIDISIWALLFLSNTRIGYLKVLGLIIFTTQIMLVTFLVFRTGLENRFLNEMVCLDSIVQVIWVFLLFYEKYKFEEIERLETQPIFWFCVGILVYAPCSYFLFALYDNINRRKENAGLWTIHGVLNTLLYMLLAVGISMNSKNRVDELTGI